MNMSENTLKIKTELIEYSKKLSEKQFVIGPGGNTSVRIGDFMYIKPSGLTFSEQSEGDLVEVDLKTAKPTPGNKRRPSSEVLMHTYIYQIRPDVKCIFHAHPPITIGLMAGGAQFGHLYPDSVAYLGKKILVLDYIVPTTEKLANYVKQNVKDHLTILLANHGVITVAENPKTAYLRMELMEALSYAIWIARSSNVKGNVKFLTEPEIDEIINLDAEKYRTALYEPEKKKN
jgi:L-fuculose-phosphate aldolase